jgi:hypothetical protein
LPELPGNCCDNDDDPTYGEPNTSTPAGKESEMGTGNATETGSLVTGSKSLAPPATESKQAPSLPRTESNAALSVSKMPPLPSPMLMNRQQQQQLRLLTPSRSVGALDQPPFGAASTTGGKSKFIPINNTRAIGRKLHIQLVKGTTTNTACTLFIVRRKSSATHSHTRARAQARVCCMYAEDLRRWRLDP